MYQKFTHCNYYPCSVLKVVMSHLGNTAHKLACTVLSTNFRIVAAVWTAPAFSGLKCMCPCIGWCDGPIFTHTYPIVVALVTDKLKNCAYSQTIQSRLNTASPIGTSTTSLNHGTMSKHFHRAKGGCCLVRRTTWCSYTQTSIIAGILVICMSQALLGYCSYTYPIVVALVTVWLMYVLLIV